MKPKASITKLDIKQLDFDPENPRFFDSNRTTTENDEATKRMIQQENIEELVGSIGNQGFFSGEPLLVTPNPDAEGRYIVVEGNRRLAALRVLNDLVPEKSLTPTLKEFADRAEKKPSHIDCHIFPKRQDILKYLGFRHISGPRRWEPLSKARYLADLIKNFYSEQSIDDQMRSVARDIGSRRDYVAQLLTALNLYDHARDKNFYDLQRVKADDISFSLLTTALSYANIVKFIGLESRDAVKVDEIKDNEFRELLYWMFAQTRNGNTVLGESRRLKLLSAVVGSDRALAELRKKEDLDQAYIFTSGPAEAFSTLLHSIESNLQDCINMLGGDVKPDESHMALIQRITEKSENLELISQKRIKAKRLEDLNIGKEK